MYFIIDLWNSTSSAYPTMLALAAAWLRLGSPRYGALNPNPRFDILNVTGNDTYSVLERTGRWYWSVCGEDRHLAPEYARRFYTRQYLVTDETGRHIDIRLWPASIWEQAAAPVRYSFWSFGSGSRPHAHREHGAHGYRRAAAAACSPLDEDAAILLTGAQQEAVKIRNRSLCPGMNDYDFYERRAHNKWAGSKCWKDQSRASRQFAKHKPGRGRGFNKMQRLNGRAPEPGEDLVLRLSRELVKSA